MTSVFSRNGTKYTIGKKCGRGGNGEVFLVSFTDEDGYEKNGVIKFFSPANNISWKKKKIRYKRFCEEVFFVNKKIEGIKGVIPIWDYNLTEKYPNKGRDAWYIMPFAEQFTVYANKSVKCKIEEFLELANTISEIHKLDETYAHRDIKPENILYYQGRICLSDFGLVYDEETSILTMANERIGPRRILPPELRNIDGSVHLYHYSDVYLFAKNLWMYLKKDNDGFSGEYQEKDDGIYLDCKEFDLETLEPIHNLMYEATKNNYSERCDIDKCIYYLNEQLAVINEEKSKEDINRQKLSEKTRRFLNTVPADNYIYCDLKKAESIIQSLLDVCAIEIIYQGKTIELAASSVSFTDRTTLVFSKYIEGKKIFSLYTLFDRLEYVDGKWIIFTLNMDYPKDDGISVFDRNSMFVCEKYYIDKECQIVLN